MSASTSATISSYYQSIQFREAPAATLESYVALVGSGGMSLADVRSAIINDPYTTNNVDPVVRLYQAAFGRVPESGDAINFYADRLADGRLTIESIARSFAASPEFQARYGADSSPNAASVTALYLNVLNRAPSSSEVAWYLNSGMTAAQMLQGFAQSPEFQDRSNAAVDALLDANALGTAVFTGALQIVTPGQTFTLTTGRDQGAAYTGGTGADSFSGTDSTLTAFDALDGGAGADSLELTFTHAVKAIPAGVEVTSIEDITIDAADDVDADISGWDGVETVAVTGFGDVTLVSAASDSVTISAAGIVEVTDDVVAEVSVTTGNFAVKIDAASATDISVVTDGGDADINAVAVTNLTVGVNGGKVSVDTESAALTISVSGDADIEEDSADKAVTDLTVNVVTASKLGLDFAAATSLAISGATSVEVDAIGLGHVESVTISGSVDVKADLSAIAALETITSTSTGAMDLTIDDTATSVTLAGGDDVVNQTAALGKTQNINLGDGDDIFVAGGALTAGATLAAGDGDDILAIKSAIVGTNASAVISGFETLHVVDALAANLAVKNFDNIQDIVLIGGSKAFAISGLTTGATVTYVAANAAGATSTLTVTGAVAGSTDVINLVFDATGEAGARDYEDVDVADVETINIATVGVEGKDSVVVGLSDDHTTLVVTGDVALTIDTAMTSVGAVDASAFDVALKIDLTGNANDVTVTAGDGDNDITGGDGDDTIVVGNGDNTIDAGKGENIITAGDGDNKITGGADIDTITTGSGDDVIVGGEGDDVIVAGNGDNTMTGGKGGDTMTGGDGVDTYIYLAAIESNGVNVDVITNFDAAEDILDLGFIGEAGGAYVGEANGFGAVLAAFGGAGLASPEAVFDTSSSLLYVDVDGDGAITVADMVIELTGVTTLDSANFLFV